MATNKEELYFKIYMDKESMDDHYVCKKVDLPATLDSIEENLREYGDLAPVIEPILLTKKQFDELPEFEGY
jgi:hypothetical protein